MENLDNSLMNSANLDECFSNASGEISELEKQISNLEYVLKNTPNITALKPTRNNIEINIIILKSKLEDAKSNNRNTSNNNKDLPVNTGVKNESSGQSENMFSDLPDSSSKKTFSTKNIIILSSSLVGLTGLFFLIKYLKNR